MSTRICSLLCTFSAQIYCRSSVHIRRPYRSLSFSPLHVPILPYRRLCIQHFHYCPSLQARGCRRRFYYSLSILTIRLRFFRVCASSSENYLLIPFGLGAMENWHLFTAAFVLSLVDLSVLGAFLWYQFSSIYFAWHLCPMIVNRICELIAFMFTGGMLPSLFAIVQVPLSLFSTTIYANRHQHLQNHLLLAVYCTLLVYECLVALLLVKMGCYLKRLESIDPQESRSLPGQQSPQPYIALHMFALFAQPLSAGCPYIGDFESELNSEADGYVTVQQPDGMKVVLGKVLQSNLESCQELDIEATKGEENGNKADHVKITIPQLPLPSSHVSDSIGEVAANSDLLAAQSSALHSQMATQNEADVIPSLRSFQAV